MTESSAPDQLDLVEGVGSDLQKTTHSSDEENGRSKPRLSWHGVILAVLAVLLVSYMIFLPLGQYLCQNLQQPSSYSKIEPMSLGEAIRLRVMQGMSGLWFFVLGGTIGSFLNVVAYRLPRGESIVTKPSSCPGCGTSIKLRDNMPVVGWLALGGRCRACGMEIDIRYPIVETLAGVVFLLFFVFQLITGSANVPGVDTPAYTGVVFIVFYPKWPHITLYLYHCLLASIILVWALIDFDTQRLRWPTQLAAFLLILAPVVLASHLLPAPWETLNRNSGVPVWLVTLGLSLLGGGVGGVLGWICQRQLNDSLLAPSVLAWVGMGLGWQAAISVLLVAMLIRLVFWLPLKVLGIQFLPLTLYLFFGFVLHHVTWRPTIETLSPYWPGAQTTLWGWIVVIGAMMGLLMSNWWASRTEGHQLSQR